MKKVYSKPVVVVDTFLNDDATTSFQQQSHLRVLI